MKYWVKIMFAAVIDIMTITALQAQTKVGDKLDAKIIYKLNDCTIYQDYASNAMEMNRISEYLDGVDNTSILVINIKSYSSPEGESKHNADLSRNRVKAAESYLRTSMTAKGIDIKNVKFETASIPEYWEGFRILVENSDLPTKNEMLAIIDSKYLTSYSKKQILKSMDSDIFNMDKFYTLRCAFIDIECCENPDNVSTVVAAPVPVDVNPANNSLAYSNMTERQDSVNSEIKKEKPKRWSIYFNGGACGLFNYRYIDDSKINHNTGLDANAGFNFLIRPWIRVGANFGYNKLVTTNNEIKSTTFVDKEYMMKCGKIGVLTRNTSDVLDNKDQQIAHGAATFDLNPFAKSKRFGMFIGAGVGYMSIWSRNSVTQAISDVAVAKDDAHFICENHDYIKTNVENSRTDALFVPMNLSFELFVGPNVSLTLGGHCYWLPLEIQNTPKWIWGSNFGTRISF